MPSKHRWSDRDLPTTIPDQQPEPTTTIRERDTMQTTTDILTAVEELAPTIAARAEEIERARRLPPDLVDRLRAAGCFRMLVPRSHGGAELDLTALLRVIEQLAAADGSAGWTVMIGCEAPVILGLLPRQTFDAVFAGGPDVIIGGALNPTGVATPTDGGFRVGGRWSFASGCQHADWFIAHCLVDGGDGAEPAVRMMLLPADDVHIEDTWWVSGLRGTGSHDFVVDDVFVPADRTFALGDDPCVDGTLHRVPELSLSTLGFAAVALGIAQGALDEILGLGTAKVPAFGTAVLAANPLFQHQLAEADARLRAARSLLHADAAAAWATADACAPFTPEHRARIRSTATWVVQAAAAVVDMAYTAGGGTSIRSSSPLQRRLRDVHAVTQHFALKLDTYTLAGAVLTGQDVDTTFL
jgi:alkylation response protein AidB-like acyl-CoA dehydrogenase